jgi:hypothetical protein
MSRSPQEIIGVKFDIDFMDAVGDWSESLTTFTLTDRIKPGKGRSGTFRLIGVDDIRHLQGFRLYLKKVAFADGTVWEDKTKACAWEQDNRRR